MALARIEGLRAEGNIVMSLTTEEVLEAALSLPEEEQFQLIEALLAARDQDGGRPFDEAWVAEIQQRSREIDAGSIRPVPWSEVRQRTGSGDSSSG